MWFVYIIQCKDKTLYTGYTNDLEKRFEKHKAGTASKYTRSHIAKRIVFFEKYDNKIVAQRREREIKNLERKDKLKLILSQDKSG